LTSFNSPRYLKIAFYISIITTESNNKLKIIDNAYYHKSLKIVKH